MSGGHEHDSHGHGGGGNTLDAIGNCAFGFCETASGAAKDFGGMIAALLSPFGGGGGGGGGHHGHDDHGHH